MTKLFSPAAERNKEPIINALREFLPSKGVFLEIASGSGQHILALADAFPELTWQPTEFDEDCVQSIRTYLQETPLDNVREPIGLDTTSPPTDLPKDFRGIICCNMIHISPWRTCLGLMHIAKQNLSSNAQVILYGPFIRNDVETAPSNMEFDRSLRARNGEWGIRHLDDVEAEAQKNGLKLQSVIEMPANNLIVIFNNLAH